jgi:hypothetical protein
MHAACLRREEQSLPRRRSCRTAQGDCSRRGAFVPAIGRTEPITIDLHLFAVPWNKAEHALQRDRAASGCGAPQGVGTVLGEWRLCEA